MGIFKVLWFIVSLPFRLLFGKKNGSAARVSPVADRSFVFNKYREIDQLMKLGHPSNYSRAVLEADKLLDHILKSFRTPGMTMGDRLKASKNRFSADAYNAAWQAHKVRNEIVHSATYDLMDYTAKNAISNYKKAIDEII